MERKSYNPFEVAQSQFDTIAGVLNLDLAARELLRYPSRECQFSIPVRMDDGSTRIFRGFRVLHSDARGPAKGGIRFHPHQTIDIVRALAMWMTWKSAVVDLPLGGSCGGVVCDPHNLSMAEQERICRGWIRRIAEEIGPRSDVLGPDVMTGAQHMVWMLDEFETIRGERCPGLITGKPVPMGGSEGRAEAPGYGLVFALREALKEVGLKPEDTRASVQGFGNVAQHAARLYNEIGGKVVAVSCWDQKEQTSYCYRKPSGVDLLRLTEITDGFGGIDREAARRQGYEVLAGEAWVEQDVDVLIPAAVESQITGENVDRISGRVRVIAEGADGPTTPDADRTIAARGIFLIPDLLASAGSVIASYLEQVQSNMNYYWARDEVLAKLDVKMTSAFADVVSLARKRKSHMRDTAFYIAVVRVVQACRDRGWV